MNIKKFTEQIAKERLLNNDKRSKFRLPTGRTFTFVGKISESRWAKRKNAGRNSNVRKIQNIAKGETTKANGSVRSTTSRADNRIDYSIEENFKPEYSKALSSMVSTLLDNTNVEPSSLAKLIHL